MNKISIKTVDGSRFEYFADSDSDIGDMPYKGFYCFPLDNGHKFFNMQNVVSVTITEVEE